MLEAKVGQQDLKDERKEAESRGKVKEQKGGDSKNK